MITLHATIGPFLNCKFQSVCIGPIKRWAQHTTIDHLSYDVPVWKKDTEIRDQYLKQLQEWKFVSNIEKHSIDRMGNIWHWFAGLTVLRYLAEAPDFVKWWHKKVYHESHDPWLTFLTGHTVYLFGTNGYAHALIAPSFTKVVNPVKVNEELKAIPTGINFTPSQSLHVLYGGCAYGFDPQFKHSGTYIPNEEGFQTHYTRIKALSETPSSPS